MQIPKVVLDAVMFTFILGFFLYDATYEQGDTGNLLIIMIVLARLVPPLQSLYNTLSSVRVGLPSLRHLMKYYGTGQNAQSLNTISSIDTLTHTINHRTIRLVDLNFNKPGIFSILGASGSGKSTLIDILTGLKAPDEFMGQRRAASTIILTNSTYVAEQTAIDFFKKSLKNLEGHERELFDLLELEKFINRPFDNFQITSSGDNISNGQRQRLLILKAFIQRPKMLVLDEATSGFSKNIELELLKFLDKQDCVVFFVTHRDMEFNFAREIHL